MSRSKPQISQQVRDAIQNIRNNMELLRTTAPLDIDRYHELVVLQIEFTAWAKGILRD